MLRAVALSFAIVGHRTERLGAPQKLKMLRAVAPSYFAAFWLAWSEKRDASTRQRRARAQTLDGKSRADARGPL